MRNLSLQLVKHHFLFFWALFLQIDVLKSMLKKHYKLFLAPELLQVVNLEQEADVLLSAQILQQFILH